MGVDIGGRLTPTEATTIPTQRLTAEVIIMGVTVIITQRRTTILLLALTVGSKLHMALMAQQPEARRIIPTPGLMLEAHQSRPLMAAEVQRKPIIHTPEPMLRRDKVRIQTRNGVALTSRGGTRAPRWDITPPRMAR